MRTWTDEADGAILDLGIKPHPLHFNDVRIFGEERLVLVLDSKATESRVGRPITRGCGTEAAYKRHKRHGQVPCAECKAAYAAAHRAYYAKRHGL